MRDTFNECIWGITQWQSYNFSAHDCAHLLRTVYPTCLIWPLGKDHLRRRVRVSDRTWRSRHLAAPNEGLVVVEIVACSSLYTCDSMALSCQDDFRAVCCDE